jgi:hypothetical protein
MFAEYQQSRDRHDNRSLLAAVLKRVCCVQHPDDLVLLHRPFVCPQIVSSFFPLIRQDYVILVRLCLYRFPAQRLQRSAHASQAFKQMILQRWLGMPAFLSILFSHAIKGFWFSLLRLNDF